MSLRASVVSEAISLHARLLRRSHLLAMILVVVLLAGCAHGKIPVILDHPPAEPYEVIQSIETKTDWHGLNWIWQWWHYMPWYSTIYKMHDKQLIKIARRLNADAIINVKYLPRRRGAVAEAIRYKPVSKESKNPV